MGNDQDRRERMAWWRDAKFGMFVHWGCYYPCDYVVISKIGPKIRKAELMTTGQPLTVKPLANARWRISGLPPTPPDDLAPVMKIEFEGPPYRLAFSDDGWLDGKYEADS